jgi:SNF2 family DNA or RNA helicase
MYIAIEGNTIRLTKLGDSYARLWSTGLFRYNAQRFALEAKLGGAAEIDVLASIARVTELPAELAQRYRLLRESRQRAINALAEDKPAPVLPCKVNATLMQHQIRGVNAALWTFGLGDLTNRGYGYLFDMGTGKTLTSIALISALYPESIDRVLIVCPSTLIGSWAQEFDKFAAFPVAVAQLMGDKAKRLKELDNLSSVRSACKVAIINYESTFRDGLDEALADYNADLIICDESQRIKNAQAQQSKAMHKLADKAKFRVILSGTPIQNSPIDIFSQYRFLDGTIFGSNFYAFRSRYAIMGGYGNHQIIGYRNLNEITTKAYQCAYRVMLNDCVDLPEQIFEDRILTFAPKEQAIYNELKREGIAEIEKDEGNVKVLANTVLAQITRLRQMTGGFAQDIEGGEPQNVNSVKLDALEDIIDDYVLETGKKIVVFATFRAEIAEIEKMLKRKKVGYGLIDGDVDIKDRAAIVDDFQNNPNTKVFVAQTQTAGLGITLTAASITVFYSMSYNAADYNQAIARTHRIGQKEKTTYIHLIVKGTIDETIKKMVDKKITLADALLNDGWREIIK